MRKMIRTESDLWTAMTDVIEARGWFGERFEDRTRQGLPDCFLGAGKAHRVWIELKVEGGRYRPGQEAWAVRADSKGEVTRTLRCTWDQRFILTDTAAEARAALFGHRPRPPIIDTQSLVRALVAALQGILVTDPATVAQERPWEPTIPQWPGKVDWPGPRGAEKATPYGE